MPGSPANVYPLSRVYGPETSRNDGGLCGVDHLDGGIVGGWAILKTGVLYGKSTRRVVCRRWAGYTYHDSILLRRRGLGILQGGKAVKGSPEQEGR
jgi:hypothetical protein